MAPSRAQRAKTAQRRKQAIDLRVAGAKWEQIAEALDYSDKAAAWKDVDRALQQNVAEQRSSAEVLKEIELQRLDAIQRGHWPNAVKGDTRAADTVLKVIDRRIRLEGLDIPPDVEARIRAEMVGRLGAQMFMVLGQVLDGLSLSQAQREAAPELIRQALAMFGVTESRQIDGEIADANAVESEAA